MWVEAVLPLEDLGSPHLSDPAPCTLVPDVGLRVACKAKVHWPMLGFDVPVTAHSLTLLLKLEIARVAGVEVLAFELEMENASSRRTRWISR